METISAGLLTFLLNSLWQIAVVTAVAALVCRVLGRGPASHRHAVWMAALVASLVLPLASVRPRAALPAIELPLPLAPSAAAIGHAAPARLMPPVASRPAPAPSERSVRFAATTANLLAGAYLIFLLYGCARLGRAWFATVRIRRAAKACPVPAALEEVRTRCESALGLRGVELLCSAQAASPLTAGVWRKSIILPEPLFAETDADVLTTAIGHEMAHIARRDVGINALCELLRLPVAFHPAAAILRRGIEQTREMACDELVTRRLIEPRAYARSLASIAATMMRVNRAGYALSVFDGDSLEERVRRLVEKPAANFKRARLLLATGLAALAACVVIASGLALTARAQSAEREEMTLGVDAYNRGEFQNAQQHFQNAVRLAPSEAAPKLFLGYVLLLEMNGKPGAAMTALVDAARTDYQDVLALDPQNRLAMQGMMVVEMAAMQPAQARQWIDKLIQIDPKEKGAYYTAAVMDWATVFPRFQLDKQAAGGKPEDYTVADANARRTMREQYLPAVEDGLRMLGTALQLDPNYSDAMAYTNLLLRLEAGLVDNPAEAANLLAQADGWVGKAIAARRASPPSPPAVLNVDGPPPAPFSMRTSFAAPPPPPPPPPPPSVTSRAPASSLPFPAPRNPAEVTGTYWQVTGASGITADELGRQLRAKNFNVRVIYAADRVVRVMAGPYSDAQAAAEVKTALEAAGFNAIRTW